MSRPQTHYDVLGVPLGATQEAIRRAYRALARIHHPDVNRDAGAQERFGRIAEAYEVLSDARRRRSYDRQLRAPGGGEAGQNRGESRPAAGRAHYTWSNVAGEAATRPDRSELDEMYDAFFGSEGQDPTGPA